jgi:hypothetical protein
MLFRRNPTCALACKKSGQTAVKKPAKVHDFSLKPMIFPASPRQSSVLR